MNYDRLRYVIVCGPGSLSVLLAVKPFGTAGMGLFGGSAVALSVAALIWKPPRTLLLSGLLSIALALSVLMTGWPLHLAFRLSESAFDRAAQRILQGETTDEAQWIGLFRVGKTELNHRGVPSLWTGLDPSGYTGFAACGPVDPPFNIWEHQVMNERWQLILED